MLTINLPNGIIILDSLNAEDMTSDEQFAVKEITALALHSVESSAYTGRIDKLRKALNKVNLHPPIIATTVGAQ
ncbi:MAG: hypothetical protein P9M15_01755 [Candidatus Electryoneaceae bacterium]|nr:hypothetical protein [Candidatus Electryoneaceae bacterium]